MKQIAAIRTNRWTGAERRILATLQQVFGEDVVVVFHNRPADVDVPVPVVDINDDWVVENGLGLCLGWGWRCGDYFYYALRAARPDCDFYWLIEPDVFFNGDATSFFSAFDGNTDDILGVNPGPFNDKSHRFLETLQHLAPYRAIFALTRFSGRALDKLLDIRKENFKIQTSEQRTANDEFFTFSNAQADPELTIGNLTKGAPGWFEHGIVETNPDMLLDALIDRPEMANQVFHPVKEKDAYKNGIATRLSSRTGFVGRSRASLEKLSPEDLEDIANLARDSHLATLRAAWQRAQKAKANREGTSE